jgi:pyruvate kinase
MNVARLNMSHGDHNSHLEVIKLVREYNRERSHNVIAIMLDTKVSALGLLFFCRGSSSTVRYMSISNAQ